MMTVTPKGWSEVETSVEDDTKRPYHAIVTKEIGGWYCKFYDDGQIAEEFGLDQIPLGFKDDAEPKHIIERMRLIHPDYEFFVLWVDKDSVY